MLPQEKINTRLYLLFEDKTFIGYTYERTAAHVLKDMCENLDIKIVDADKLRKKVNFLTKKDFETIVEAYRPAKYHLYKYIKFNE